MFTTLYCLSFWTMFSRHAFGLKSGHPTVKISSLNLVILSLDILLLIGSLIDCRFFALFPCNLSHDRFDYRCPSDNLLSLRPWCCTGSFQKLLLNPLMIRSDPDYHDATAGSNQGLDPFSLLSLLERPGFAAGIDWDLLFALDSSQNPFLGPRMSEATAVCPGITQGHDQRHKEASGRLYHWVSTWKVLLAFLEYYSLWVVY